MRDNSLKLRWGLPVALLLGCPAASESSTENGSDSSSSSSAQTSTDSATTITMTTTTDTISGSATSATTAETTSPDGSGTTDVSSEDTANATASTSSSGSGSSSSSSSSSGGTPDGAYGECDLSDPMNPTCAVAGEDCNLINMGADGSWCSIPCETDDDCPAPGSGEAVGYCSMTFGHCALSCSDGMGGTVACPDGMDCVQSGMSTRCAWPPA